MVAHFCEYTKKHFEWMKIMVCEIYCNEVLEKRKTNTKFNSSVIQSGVSVIKSGVSVISTL